MTKGQEDPIHDKKILYHYKPKVALILEASLNHSRFLLLIGSLTGLTLPEKNTTQANFNMRVHLIVKRCIRNRMCTNYSTMSSPTVRRMCPCPLRPSRPILNVWRLWRGGGYLWRDELGMHALREDNTKGGSPRSGHKSHVICMGWTRIIVCHGAYVISSVQRHRVCCLTCFLHGVVM